MSGPAAANPRVARVLVWGFVLAAVAVTVWGFIVVGDARRIAAQTDREVRAVAWLVLVAADRGGGMPRSEGDLLEAAAAMPGSIAGDADLRWPAKAIDAGLEPGEEVVDWADAFGRIRVVFSEDRPPLVTVAVLPTRNGTLDEVNAWIESWAEANGGEAR